MRLTFYLTVAIALLTVVAALAVSAIGLYRRGTWFAKTVWVKTGYGRTIQMVSRLEVEVPGS
ncbi:MAG: hypothetical protein QOE03_2048 [Micromonosporaceae bacterium]|nr:hypothetical protein [Micromonosporaceae bacterium]